MPSDCSPPEYGFSDLKSVSRDFVAPQTVAPQSVGFQLLNRQSEILQLPRLQPPRVLVLISKIGSPRFCVAPQTVATQTVILRSQIVIPRLCSHPKCRCSDPKSVSRDFVAPQNVEFQLQNRQPEILQPRRLQAARVWFFMSKIGSPRFYSTPDCSSPGCGYSDPKSVARDSVNPWSVDPKSVGFQVPNRQPLILYFSSQTVTPPACGFPDPKSVARSFRFVFVFGQPPICSPPRDPSNLLLRVLCHQGVIFVFCFFSYHFSESASLSL